MVLILSFQKGKVYLGSLYSTMHPLSDTPSAVVCISPREKGRLNKYLNIEMDPRRFLKFLKKERPEGIRGVPRGNCLNCLAPSFQTDQ
jgi:hypothetical protein